MRYKDSVKKAFNRLSKAFPTVAESSKPLGAGSFGLVVGHDDLSVSKYLFRSSHPEQLDFSLRGFYRESLFLKHFSKHAETGLDLPVLLDDVEELYKPDFAARYKMTRIEGSSFVSLFKGGKYRGANKHEMHERAGVLTARFHSITSDGLPAIPDRGGFDGCKIPTLPSILGDRTNYALEKADAYLLKNRKMGIVHGDLGVHNFIYASGLPSGIIDFAFSGICENQMCDFAYMDPNYVSDFIRGYEGELGISVDKQLVIATQLSFAANNLLFATKMQPENSAWHLNALDNLNVHLNNMIDVTGFKP